MKDPITTTQAAEIIGINSSMVRRYCRRGDLPAQQVGRDWMIERKDAEEFVPASVGQPKRTKEKTDKPK